MTDLTDKYGEIRHVLPGCFASPRGIISVSFRNALYLGHPAQQRRQALALIELVSPETLELVHHIGELPFDRFT
jgi:hypothetical protein